MPKISIIVPIHNVEKYVSACLESLIHQTLSDIEIICVDDRGNDKSMQIVRKFANSDKRIKIIRNWRNRGLSYSRNHGMRHAQAPYIMFCDSDDMFACDTCQVMLQAIEDNNSDVAVCGINVLYEANHELKDSDNIFFSIRQNTTFEISRANHGFCYGAAWGKIFRTDIIKQHKIKFPVGLKHEDEFFWPVYTLWAKKVTFVTEKLYTYRRRAGSIMNIAYQKSVLNIDPLKITSAYFDYCNKNGIFHEVCDWFWFHMFPTMFTAALNYSGKKNSILCMKYARRFIRKNYQYYGLDPATINKINSIYTYINSEIMKKA